MLSTRTERDSMGEMRVPAEAYYGAQTARAIENFPISGQRMPRRFIHAVALIKLAAAEASFDLGLLSEDRFKLITSAAEEILAGKLDDQFPVDIYQTGSGTSTNMNVNEVIASRANELATGRRGGKTPVHPNDHVNLQQSSNDVIPTAIHLSVALALRDELQPALRALAEALARKSAEFDDIVKIGRTHLQDATPIRLGQVFSGYRAQIDKSVARAGAAISALAELALGGTAVGTGINAHPDFARRAIAVLRFRTALDLREADNHFEAQSAKDAVVEASAALRGIALSVSTVANNLRFLSSGPRCGIGEIRLPETQPGSSIMPGKVNPVICEATMMAAARALGADAAVHAAAAQGSLFELNVMMPLMASELLSAIDILSAAIRTLAEKCVLGIQADRDRCELFVEKSLAMCTALAPAIGYDAAASIAAESARTGRNVREIAQERHVLSDPDLARALDPLRMTEPNDQSAGSGGG
jgi:fumarate hydratase class II